ncbi:MAG: hypothetical protein QOH70_3370 [Blastocatellia bacterium]|jgi:hypothetical protein|nr:hypothetical protein [Blastocatellia bacterium]
MKSNNTTAATGPDFSIRNFPSRRTRFGIYLLIFLVAVGVRLLSWHDTRLEVGKVQTAVTADYQRVAQLIRQGGVASFLSSSSPLSDLNTLGHPPGYSILMAGIFSVFGESNTAVQFVQIICDSLAAVMILLIAAELLPFSAAIVAGMLAAFSPQFAWNSVLLLPDSLAVLPILLAVYCLVRAVRKPRLVTFIIAGVLVGVSCWLRANAMFLTFFFAAAVLLLMRSQWRYALAVVFGTFLIVLPLTIRNAVVFHRFIPLSLGAGQTLLEGIADYDPQGKFGIPNTDVGIMKQEAEQSQRPDYYGTLFNPDGVERERARLSRGFAVIRSHPLWFSGVMARRAASMLRLERSRLVSVEPPVSHPLGIDSLAPVWTGTPGELSFSGVGLSPQIKVSYEPSSGRLTLVGDDSKYGDQFSSNVVNVKQNNDYVFTAPISIERGRMRISVVQPGGKVYSSTIVETIENTSAEAQPTNLVQLPFVANSNQRVQVVFSNEASNPPNPLVRVGPIKLFELGPAHRLWTRYPRLLVHGMQKIFLTAVILPLAILGLALLIIKKQSQALIILAVVPVYFFCVQSIVHTEYRYVLAVDYFLFALVGVMVSWSADILVRLSAKREKRL